MLRRKLGILMVAIIIALAGAQEAAQMFDGLKSSVNDWTRAGLWSGLIVYAQPTTDSRTDAMPNSYAPVETASATCPQATPRSDGGDVNDDASSAKKKNSHAAAAARETDAPVVEVADEVTDEVAEALRPEFETEPREWNIANANFAPPQSAAPRLPQPRAFAEIARNAPVILKFAREAGSHGDVFVSEFDAARLLTDAAQLAGEQTRFEGLKLKAHGEPEKLSRRLEVRIVRRAEHPERMPVVSPATGERREVMWAEMPGAPCAPRVEPLNAPAAEARSGQVEAAPKGAKKGCSFDCDATAAEQ